METCRLLNALHPEPHEVGSGRLNSREQQTVGLSELHDAAAYSALGV